jgi:uncharacterized protein (DUF1778 family)
MVEIAKVFRVVKWNPNDYAFICDAAKREQRSVSEYIRRSTLDAAKKTIENVQ